MPSAKQHTIDVLLDAISDAQETTRAIDLKAEILTAIVALMVGFVGFYWRDSSSSLRTGVEVVATIFGLIAMSCLIAVIYPVSNPAESVKRGTYKSTGTFFITDKTLSALAIEELAKRVTQTDWSKELTYELMKVSAIRNRKMVWFKRSVNACALAIVSVLILCVASVFF